MTIKQKKSQTILYATITLLAAVGLFCFVIFDMRKLPHDYSVILDITVVYGLFKILCLVGGFFSAAGGVYLFKQIFSKEPLMLSFPPIAESLSCLCALYAPNNAEQE